jgi:hypothetical protein
MGRYSIPIKNVTTLHVCAYSTQDAYNIFCIDLQKSPTYTRILLVSFLLNWYQRIKRFENFLMFSPCYFPCVIDLRFCKLHRRSTFLPIYTINLNSCIRKCMTTMTQDNCLIGNHFQCKLRLFLLCRAIICRT